jgi:hypothetical protein
MACPDDGIDEADVDAGERHPASDDTFPPKR